ncbi:aldehyde oxygenase (deformylating) [Cyanobium sp. ATX 6A2]|uniref:aldehyde oxygenase (deformylating) n=1 Tax=Cyanobium sp. ATX 6A2 TaxID=2823700 RepID=UPI0020CCA20B|nr:aldehyde oxygenase (deformylating) [Cyanobium sp. ATX 6A2]MCP9888248.1 aldehyde oxygenase (deformylating) [Cyanobium sp. ATX 6A2]
MSGTPTATLPRSDAPAYRDAYSRINGLVIVGEGMADRHFRRLAALLPEQRDELLRLGAMEGRHAVDFAGCGRHLEVRPDQALARRLLAPLHQQFLEAERQGDLVSCLVIQCLIIECFAVAAYRLYLPVADAYAQPITAAVMRDEAEHLNFGEQWLRPRFAAVAERVEACAGRAVPVALAMLSTLEHDLEAIGIDPEELVAEFVVEFQASLEAIGYTAGEARRLLNRLTARALSAPAVRAGALS